VQLFKHLPGVSTLQLSMSNPYRLHVFRTGSSTLQSGPYNVRGQSHRPSSSLQVPCAWQPGLHAVLRVVSTAAVPCGSSRDKASASSAQQEHHFTACLIHALRPDLAYSQTGWKFANCKPVPTPDSETEGYTEVADLRSVTVQSFQLLHAKHCGQRRGPNKRFQSYWIAIQMSCSGATGWSTAQFLGECLRLLQKAILGSTFRHAPTCQILPGDDIPQLVDCSQGSSGSGYRHCRNSWQ
jgi:hypothetical protein